MASTVTAFLADRRIGSGDRETLTRLIEERYSADRSAILVFEDDTGRITDLDYGGAMTPPAPRGPGRPRLGVQPREVTLLPRHWEWLAGQPGGASAVLRRLVEEARRKGRTQRDRQNAAYHFMQAACGDRPGYEEALRALYKADEMGFFSVVDGWPADIRNYIVALLAPEAQANREPVTA